MTEKLDSFSKILVATGQINYLASCINSVNTAIKMIPDEKGVHTDSIKDRDDILTEAADKLAAIMEDLADLMNDQDFAQTIDVRLTKAPFGVLLHGMDETEVEYESQ